MTGLNESRRDDEEPVQLAEREETSKEKLSVEEILIGANLVSIAEITEARRRSHLTGKLVVQILAEAGKVPQRYLSAALTVSSLLAYDLIKIPLAYKALALMNTTTLPLESALKMLGWRAQDHSGHQSFLKLGHLLLDADCVNKEDLGAALEACLISGLPLLRTLILRKIMSPNVAYAAISAQVLLSKKAITRQEAIAIIRRSSSTGGAIHAQIRREDVLRCAEVEGIRLGELLNSSGAISDVDLISAVEQSLFQRRLIGTILTENGAISTSVLRSALEVQAQSKLGVLTIEAAIEAASLAAQIHGKNRPEPAKKTELATRLVNFSGLTQNEESNPEVSELLLQKKNLAFKLVNQYEEITNSVARDLHDTVLADLLAIHRNLSKDEKSEANENLPLLEGVIRQLRELCGEYAPRNISDWGLETVLEDLMDRFERRTQVIGTFIWKARQVSLPEQVELQVFRIVQEALNNVSKHAKASNVILKVEEKSINTLTISLSDDGQGFPAGAKKQGNSFESGGMGTHNVTERMELIRCYYPATLKIESVPQQGVTVTLEIVISST